ncbi:MAG: phasin family protein [Armatimonadota bacterium]
MTEERETNRGESWGDIFERMVELGLGAVTLTADTAQKVVSDLVARGKVAREESERLTNRLTEMGKEQRESLREMIDRGTERTMKRLDVARRSDVEALRQRIANLEQAVLGAPIPSEPIRMVDIEEEDFDTPRE